MFRHRRYEARRSLRDQRRRKSALVERLDAPARAVTRDRLATAIGAVYRAYPHRPVHVRDAAARRIMGYLTPACGGCGCTGAAHRHGTNRDDAYATRAAGWVED